MEGDEWEDEEDWCHLHDDSGYLDDQADLALLSPIQSTVASTSHNRGDQHPRTIIHVDIDCYYAQVEMIRNPELTDKPLGIQQKHILVTCNYKAREFGVTKLMSIKVAKQKCPHIVIVNGEDLTHYREMSYKITDTLLKYSPKVERLGFDENFIDVTDVVSSVPWKDYGQLDLAGHVYNNDNGDNPCACGCHTRLRIGAHIAREMRRTLAKELSITCCAGVAHNKLLAKLVAGSHKPNDQTLIYPRQAAVVLSSLDRVGKLPGIGWNSAKKLAALNIQSINELKSVAMATLQEEFGVTMATMMKNLCEGIDESPVVTSGQPQSMSDEDSFKCCNTVADAKLRIQQLASSLLVRLKQDGRLPQTLRLSVRKVACGNKWLNRESRQCPLLPHVFKNLNNDPEKVCEEVVAIAMTLFKKMVEVPFHLTLINVCFAKLQEKSVDNRSSIMKFLTESGHKAKDLFKNSSEVCETDDTKQSGKVKVVESHNKRKSESLIHDWMSKRQKTDNNTTESDTSNKSLQTNHSLTFTESDKNQEQIFSEPEENEHLALPDNIDQEVLKALPPDMQQEILASQQLLKANVQSVSVETGFDKGIEPIPEINKESGENSEISKSSTLQQIIGKDQNSHKCQCPPNIDPTVFAELPNDIKQQLITDWDFKQKSTIRSQKQTKNSIMKYLKKS